MIEFEKQINLKMYYNKNRHTFNLLFELIKVLDSTDRQLSLQQISHKLGVTPVYFEQVFSQWSGVSSKRYQEYFALDYCNKLLIKRHDTLDNSPFSALPNPKVPNNLFVTTETMRLRDFTPQKCSTKVNYSWMDSPFGKTLVMGTERGLCGIAFSTKNGWIKTLENMKARWPNATFIENSNRLQKLGNIAFGQSDRINLHLIGTPFQIRVWKILLQIPSGYVSTYSDIALRMGAPKAVRAVGSAVGRNPISWLIPCHRVLRKSGDLGGYHWGLPLKRAMLAFEGLQNDCGMN